MHGILQQHLQIGVLLKRLNLSIQHGILLLPQVLYFRKFYDCYINRSNLFKTDYTFLQLQILEKWSTKLSMNLLHALSMSYLCNLVILWWFLLMLKLNLDGLVVNAEVNIWNKKIYKKFCIFMVVIIIFCYFCLL